MGAEFLNAHAIQWKIKFVTIAEIKKIKKNQTTIFEMTAKFSKKHVNFNIT